jgi:phenylacetate-CoA ligase
MSTSERAYQHLPIWLQNRICSYVGGRIQRSRYNDEFHRLLTEYCQRLGIDAGSLAAYRDRRLASLVVHAAKTVPYYRRKFAESHFEAERIRSLDDLSILPVLTKAEVQAHLKELQSETLTRRECYHHHTSGTTGTGLVFPTTHQAQRHQWAVWWRYRVLCGLSMDQWCGLFVGRPIVPRSQVRPPFWRTNLPGRRILFSGYHLRPDWLSAYVDEIKRSRLTWLHGYPSHLNLLAQYVLEHKVSFDPPIMIVTIGAESLLEHQRTNIVQAFGCQIRQHYGLAEAVANISECPFGTLHVDEDFSAVEFIPTGEESGYRIIGTNFTNPAFPLLRYDTGDLAFGLAESNSCQCGRAGRTVTRIDGRVEDAVTLKDGTRVGRLDHILKDMTKVREAQFVQAAPGRLVLRIVRGPEFSPADERAIRNESQLRLGRDLDLSFEYCDRLPRSGTGKLRFVVTEPEHRPGS